MKTKAPKLPTEIGEEEQRKEENPWTALKKSLSGSRLPFPRDIHVSKDSAPSYKVMTEHNASLDCAHKHD